MNLPVAAVPDVPEIWLHKARPTSGLMRLARQDEEGFGAPYWAHYWAGGLALARYVLDHPGVVAGKRVLDLGAGSGLVGIAAAKAGAREVVAAEVDGYAVAALQLNMKLNEASISVLHSDVTERAPPETDLVLVGDLFYAPDLSERVTSLSRSVFEPGDSRACRRSLAGSSASFAPDGIGALSGHGGREPRDETERRLCVHASRGWRPAIGVSRKGEPRLAPPAAFL